MWWAAARPFQRETRACLVARKGRVEGAVQGIDDGARGTGGVARPPQRHFVADKAGLSQSRYLRYKLRARSSSDRERADGSRGNVAVGVGNGADENTDMAPSRSLRAGAPFIGNVQHFHAGAMSKQLMVR